MSEKPPKTTMVADRSFKYLRAPMRMVETKKANSAISTASCLDATCADARTTSRTHHHDVDCVDSEMRKLADLALLPEVQKLQRLFMKGYRTAGGLERDQQHDTDLAA